MLTIVIVNGITVVAIGIVSCNCGHNVIVSYYRRYKCCRIALSWSQLLPHRVIVHQVLGISFTRALLFVRLCVCPHVLNV